MSQSSILFGGLFIGFIVYVTMKGELSSYTAVLWGAVPATSQSASAQTANQATATAASVNNLFGSALGSSNPATAQNIVTGQSGDQIGTTITSMINAYQRFNTAVQNLPSLWGSGN